MPVFGVIRPEGRPLALSQKVMRLRLERPTRLNDKVGQVPNDMFGQGEYYNINNSE